MVGINYPTEWHLGKPRGSIKDVKGGFMLTISPPNSKQISSFFSISKYGTEEQAFKEAKKQQSILSNEHELTRNQIRYISKDTIEVKLTNDQIMITDAKHLNKVQMYPLQAKPKKEKNGIKYYVLYQDKKKTGRFIDLIGDYKIIQFINGNSLDLREHNLKEFGTVCKKVNCTDKIISRQYEYFNISIDQLPINEWILGKPMGTIFKRSNSDTVITVRVTDMENNQHTKTFSIKDYKNENEAMTEAKKWQIETSYKLGITKNLIKIIDNDTIEIKITKNNIFKTNKIFIPLIQKIHIFTLTSGNQIQYAYCSIANKNIMYHSLISGFELTDHLNGDTMDNRLQNLRPATYSMNNSNRHLSEIYQDDIGVKQVNTIFGKAYKASIKLEGVEYAKYYSVNKFTEDGAKTQAKLFRKKLTKCTNISDDLSTDDDTKLLKFLLVKLQHIIDHTTKSIIYDYDQYLCDIDLPKNIKKHMYQYYLYQMLLYNIGNENSQEKIKNLIIKKMLL